MSDTRAFKLSPHGESLLNEYYMAKTDKSPLDAFKRACFAYTENKALSERLFEYVKKGWFMFSSPVLSNAGGKGLPISCFLTYVDDSLEGLIEHTEELRWMSTLGGGVGGHWSNVRSVSDKSPGPIPFINTVDADMVAYRQGKTRKGSYAAYLDISHPDILEFLNLRVPTGGDVNRKCFNLHNAINITDKFMQAVFEGKSWDLIDPNSGEVRDTEDARNLWERIIKTRFRTGEPYLCFIDTANRALPQSLKDKGLKIHGSNLCSEIMLPTSATRSAVCCLSSLNLEFFDEWSETTIVEDLIEFLDDVLEYFIMKAPSHLEKAIISATAERSLGLGAMGFHSYLQRKGVPFESVFAQGINHRIFSHIKERAVSASKRLAEEKAEYNDGVGTGMRNSHLLAIAPNANSAIILDTSPSIEPISSNAFTYRSRAGTFLHTNKYLVKLLEEKGVDVDETLKSVISEKGSVQHLDCLTDYEKQIFKTASELDQMWVIEHASARQEYICQGQSVNLFFPAGSEANYVNAVHLSAFKKGLKALYYLRTDAGVTADKVSQKVERKKLSDYKIEECLSCQG
jgi:ribonucleoside-diphosphate reductase alpha chain